GDPRRHAADRHCHRGGQPRQPGDRLHRDGAVRIDRPESRAAPRLHLHGRGPRIAHLRGRSHHRRDLDHHRQLHGSAGGPSLGAKVVTVQFGTAGEQTLSATDTLISSITGSKKTLVVHGPAAQLVLSGIPPSTVAGTTLTASVTAVDGHGNVATDFTGAVHFASTDPTAALTKDFVF